MGPISGSGTASTARSGVGPGCAQHEDRVLVDALVAGGVPAAAGLEVVTSGRLTGRAPGGFSGFLRNLVRMADRDDAVVAEDVTR